MTATPDNTPSAGVRQPGRSPVTRLEPPAAADSRSIAAAVRAHRSRGGSGCRSRRPRRSRRSASYPAATARHAGQPARCASSQAASSGSMAASEALGGEAVGALVDGRIVAGPAPEPPDATHRCPPGDCEAAWFASAVGLGGTFRGERLAQALACPGQERACGDVADAERGGQLDTGQVVQFGQQEGGALSLRDAGQRPLHVARQVGVHHQALGGRRRSARLAGPREEPDDLPPADLIERDPVGDLVQPGAGVLGLLEGLVVPVGLDERVLGQVGGELGLAEHPEEIGVDLAVMLGEQGLDEGPGLVVVPQLAHRAGPGPGQADEAQGSANVCESGFGDHRYSERDAARSAVIGRRTLVGPMTVGLPPV